MQIPYKVDNALDLSRFFAEVETICRSQGPQLHSKCKDWYKNLFGWILEVLVLESIAWNCIGSYAWEFESLRSIESGMLFTSIKFVTI